MVVQIVDIQVGPYINALLELYNLLELSIDKIESIVDVNIHDLQELSKGFPWVPSINQLVFFQGKLCCGACYCCSCKFHTLYLF